MCNTHFFWWYSLSAGDLDFKPAARTKLLLVLIWEQPLYQVAPLVPPTSRVDDGVIQLQPLYAYRKAGTVAADDFLQDPTRRLTLGPIISNQWKRDRNRRKSDGENEQQKKGKHLAFSPFSHYFLIVRFVSAGPFLRGNEITSQYLTKLVPCF